MRHCFGTQKTLRVTVLPTLLAGLLAACGGGGITGQDLTGKVMDGYIKGAVVCLDVNANGVCNTDEPQAETTTGGAYTLNVPTDADLGGTNLLVEVPVGAIDEDSPNTPIATAYKMRGVASAEAVVSPLTTVLAAHLDNGETEADALTAMGLTDVDLKADYVASGNTKVHNVAKLLARNFQAAGTQTAAQMRARVATIKASLQTAHATTTAMTADQVAALIAATPEDSNNLLANGNFESGVTGWTGNALQVRTEGGNSYNFADVVAAGEPYNVNLSYPVSIPALGTQYKLTFKASSNRDRALKAGIGLNGDPWTNTVEDVSLTSTEQTFELVLTSNFASESSRVIFDMGHDTGHVVIDDVKLEVLDTNLVTNGNFESGVTGWTGNALQVRTEGGNSYNFADVVAAGEPYNVNLSYPISLPTQGATYQLKFTASSNRTRALKAGLGLNSDPWTNVIEDITLTTEPQTFDLTIETNFASENSRIIFDMGHDTGHVVIDEVILKPINVESSGGGGTTGSTPTTSAPEPTAAAGNVTSVFSDAYTSLAVQEWGPDWGPSSARITDATVGSDNVKVIDMAAGKVFAGISFTDSAFDATAATHFNMDYWIASPLPAGMVINVKLSNHDGGNGETSALQYTQTNVIAGSWQTLSIPLADFVAAAENGVTARNAIAQVLVTAARADGQVPVAIYFDNMYFSQ
jgi:endoglucanase